MLVGARARGGRGGRVLVGVHEPDIRVEHVVVAVEHRQRDADPEHEEHGPDREPRKRTLAAGRRAHRRMVEAGRRRLRRSRTDGEARDCRHGRPARAPARAALRRAPARGRRGHDRRAPRRRRGARPAARARAERARRRRRGRHRRRSPRASAPAAEPAGRARALRARRPCGSGSAAGTSRARARRPTRAPARCPTCAPPATLEQDLLRRDVTINALALDLADGDAARRPARRGGPRRRAGCACCTTRASSTTRRGCGAWRATRRGWASRSRSTRPGSRAEAVAGGALETVSGPRIGNELRLALAEPDPVAALDAAVAIGAAPWLAPDRALTERALALLPRRRGAPRPARAGRRAARARRRRAARRAWSSPPPSARSCARASRRRRSTDGRRARASELARALRDLPVEAVALAGRARRAARPRGAGWTSCATSALQITGADLLRGRHRGGAGPRPPPAGRARPAPGRRAGARPRGRAGGRAAGRAGRGHIVTPCYK